MNVELRTSDAGNAHGFASAARSAAVNATLPPPKARHAASMSATDVVSSHARVSSVSDSRRKLTPCWTPAAITSSTDMPAGGETRIVSKYGASAALHPSLTRPARRSDADDWQWPAISVRPSGPWYMPYIAEMFARSACHVDTG